jgi:hypothetical protein
MMASTGDDWAIVMLTEKAGQRMGDVCDDVSLIKYGDATANAGGASVAGDFRVMDLMAEERAAN